MTDFIPVPRRKHDALVAAAFLRRGFQADEVAPAVFLCAEAARHGVRPHIALRALFTDHYFGSATGGCVPGAEVEVVPSRFPSSEVWNANKKFGPAVAYRAIDRAIELADKYGIGQIAVDNASPYLWGAGYVMAAAERGFIAYTQATSPLAEVAPFGGNRPTLGTNPHSWAFPTSPALGFPLLVDWITSNIDMHRVETARRTGKSLPPDSAIDANGQVTTDPHRVHALLPFGTHKGYGLSLINELLASFIGGSLPSLRSRLTENPKEKNTATFFFQVIHPEALSSSNFANGRSQLDNLKHVLADILRGNPDATIPGQLEADFRFRSDEADGLLFTRGEIDDFNKLAESLGQPPLHED
ncbi:MAG: Ldh family oxidoreductase [Verrucomicrobiota bacterium JB023]|nr:Ldh family oxidoreductase [Verrucomicrobiota bacterium JB023]